MQSKERRTDIMARYDVNLSASIGRGPFIGSRVVTIAPAFVLVNASGVPIEVCQHRSSVVVTLSAGEARPWPWFSSEAKVAELLARPVTAMAWRWSGRFSIADVGNYNIRLTSALDASKYTIFPIGVTMQVLVYIPSSSDSTVQCAAASDNSDCVMAIAHGMRWQCNIKLFACLQGYSHVCSFGAVQLRNAPYRIENACSGYRIAVRQKGGGEWKRPKSFFCLQPKSAPHPFAWDELPTPQQHRQHVQPRQHRLAAVALPTGVTLAPIRACGLMTV
jgi:SHR-binding domain of vacuolar-sorting associated protein 13